MEEPMEVASSGPLHLHSLRSQVRDLMEAHKSNYEFSPEIAAPSDSDKLLNDCALHLESKVKDILSEYSDVSLLGIDDSDAYLEHLKEELKTVEAESAKISNEIENLSRTQMEGCNSLESDLEQLNCALELLASQGLERAKLDPHPDCITYGEDESELINIHEDNYIEVAKLEHQIEENKMTLNSLQEIDSLLKRFDAVERVEDSLTGLKVIEFDGNVIRLSLQTYIPKLERLSYNLEDVSVPSEVNHEMLIEIIDGMMELKNVEIFPNDVYIGDIVDAAKSGRWLFSPLAVLETKSSLQWFVGQVQDRITLCTLRRLCLKSGNKSRHSFTYVDRDETVIAHLVGGIDAFIKCQGWPLSNSPLKLISLKSSDSLSKEISSDFLCKVEEVTNSMDLHIQQNLSNFVDAIEKTIVKLRHMEHHPDYIPGI